MVARRAPKTGQIERTRTAAIDAARRILMREGYRALRIEDVVAESGISRASIYRHFGDVTGLALCAFEAMLGEPPPNPDTGNLRDDLVRNFERLVRSLRRASWGKLVLALVEASLRDRQVRKILQELSARRRVVTMEMLERGVERGEISPDTDCERLLDRITGPIYYRFLISGDAIDEQGFVEHLVDASLSVAREETGAARRPRAVRA